ncbi:MAG TPA: delta-lactam-biosynthetic de-N-acetylase [Candidatus Merdenecus merdavium]|nr:delta-lactam-biosynthetic de-N-acetylase [Candidatus Merdenecus merdavium]
MKIMKKIVAILSVFLCIPITAMAAEGNWGLGYGAEGEKPTGNTSAEELAQNNAYFVDPTDEKVIYLTFDAGYENGNTDQILDVLKETDVPAAFFVVGTYIRDHQDLIKRMADEGHIVGNHSMSHPDMTKKDRASFTKELSDTADLYKQVVGEDMPMYYRPPQGKYSKENLELAKELGYTTVFWSLAYVDWNVDDQPTKEQAFSKLIPRVHPGTILLLHSTSDTNANILKELIEEYQSMGYTFKSLDQLGN